MNTLSITEAREQIRDLGKRAAKLRSEINELGFPEVLEWVMICRGPREIAKIVNRRTPRIGHPAYEKCCELIEIDLIRIQLHRSVLRNARNPDLEINYVLQ